MGAGCGAEMKVNVQCGWSYREITVKCGNTSPTGFPYQCYRCGELNAGRQWRREAAEAGETWGEEDY